MLLGVISKPLNVIFLNLLIHTVAKYKFHYNKRDIAFIVI